MEQTNNPHNPEITLNLTLMDVNKLNDALAEKPLKDSIDLFMKVREQTMKQLQALQSPVPANAPLADKVVN